MRDREQIELNVSEFHTAKQVERQRTLVQLLTGLKAAQNTDWYQWVLSRSRGEHRHDLKMADGKTPAACPVRGCQAVQTNDQRRVA